MLTLFVSLVFFLLTRLSAAQFDAYPSCVQPLLYAAFPASCLSLSLAAQNTCLCQDANAFGSAFVTGIYRQCGCADLEETVQLSDAYCTQVGIDIGPAFTVFIQDDTTCGDNSRSGASTGTGTATSTATGVSTSTGTADGTSTGAGGTKNSGANNRLIVEQIVQIVVGVTGGILAL